MGRNMDSAPDKFIFGPNNLSSFKLLLVLTLFPFLK